MLSGAQFGELAAQARPQALGGRGGFTIDTATGQRPNKGYAVSMAGAERKIPIWPGLSSSIGAYAQRHAASLAQPGVHLGGWGPEAGEGGPGHVVLDNTQVIANRRKASRAMVEENQDAIYGLGSEKTISNVFKQRPTTFQEPAEFDREGFEHDVANLYRKASGRSALPA